MKSCGKSITLNYHCRNVYDLRIFQGGDIPLGAPTLKMTRFFIHKESRDKLRILYLHLQKNDGDQARQDGKLK